ncbi:MAG: glutamate--tRNA ligase [Chitinophagaceae bacterium]|nr:glutamate--tRNA ligase [Chitinophagaceae bacterium]
MSKNVRVRFAPSPTGGLHLGGVRTALYNYLFAKQQRGDFILRIEDTDQSRFVEGAEKYITECLNWCELIPDEAPHIGGTHEPYRQSQRKEIYHQYAMQLVDSGHAYYAFDTPEEIEHMRGKLKSEGKSNLQYDHHTRMLMNNSLSRLPEETSKAIDQGIPYVIRLKIDPDAFIYFKDMIRGEMTFDTNNLDDKVLLKADGMPTYHLAVVVDDYLMKITHVFRGEEWLPSAPAHVMIWKYLGWENAMPQWVHLPLILKPDGNGKLSKRDGDRLGFPVFAMNWKDPKTSELMKGFKELGFLPEAFINMLAMLGWNDGTEQEIFNLEELIQKFSIERIHKAGAKFDFEKAKWFNHEWIKKLPVSHYSSRVAGMFTEMGITINDTEKFNKILELVKDRCTLLTGFWDNAHYFYKPPAEFDTASLTGKWNDDKKDFFESFITLLPGEAGWNSSSLENIFKTLAAEKKIKAGELLMIFRIILVGSKTGPGVFAIAEILGKEETIKRINLAIAQFVALNIK